MRTWTTAPESYDGFGTETVRVAGTDRRGREVREVETPAAHVEWQRQRYCSGAIYMVADAREWAKLVEAKLVEVADEPAAGDGARDSPGEFDREADAAYAARLEEDGPGGF